jgi:hypothetical protein
MRLLQDQEQWPLSTTLWEVSCPKDCVIKNSKEGTDQIVED